jgi:Tol biopolymer transport system component
LRLLVCTAVFAFVLAQDKNKTKTQDPPKPKDPSSKLLTAKGSLLFKHPTDKLILETMNVSDNGKIAFVVKTKDSKERVMLNGVAQKPYTNIVPIDLLAAAQSLPQDQQARLRASRGALSQIIKFAPNFEKVYYVSNNGKGNVIASDGYESKNIYEAIMEGMPVISPDSKKIAFAGMRAGRLYVVVNDAESAAWDDIQVGTLVFSPNSVRLAYCARKQGEWKVYHDGTPFNALEGIAEGSPIFSPDSKKIAYIAFTKQNKQVVMLDGRAFGEFDAVGERQPIFSPDSQTFAFAAKLRGKWYVYINDKQHGPYDAVIEGTPTFSKDSKRVVWAAQIGKEWFVFENGKELTYPTVIQKKKPEPIKADMIFKGTPVFSPDGKKLAFGMKREGAWVVWCEGQESEKFEDLHEASLRFSWDSSRLGFVGIRQKKYFPVLNSKVYPEALDISPTRVSGNPTSSTIAWAVKHPRTPEQIAEARKKNPEAGDTFWMIMMNGEELYGPYDAVQQGALSVSWDGLRAAIPAKTKEGWGIWINGERRTDGLPIWIRFNPDTHLMEMIAVTPEGYFLVKEVYE